VQRCEGRSVGGSTLPEPSATPTCLGNEPAAGIQPRRHLLPSIGRLENQKQSDRGLRRIQYGEKDSDRPRRAGAASRRAGDGEFFPADGSSALARSRLQRRRRPGRPSSYGDAQSWLVGSIVCSRSIDYRTTTEAERERLQSGWSITAILSVS